MGNRTEPPATLGSKWSVLPYEPVGAERDGYHFSRPIHLFYQELASVRGSTTAFISRRIHQTSSTGSKQVANAVPPLLAEAMGHQIIAIVLSVIPLPRAGGTGRHSAAV